MVFCKPRWVRITWISVVEQVIILCVSILCKREDMAPIFGINHKGGRCTYWIENFECSIKGKCECVQCKLVSLSWWFVVSRNHLCVRFMVSLNHLCVRFMVIQDHFCVRDSWLVETIFGWGLWSTKYHFMWWFIII